MIHLLLGTIRKMQGTSKPLGILTLSVTHSSNLERLYGWEAIDEIVRGVAECLQTVKRDCLRRQDLLAELTVNGNAFVLLLSPPRYRRTLRYQDLAQIRERIYKTLERSLRKRMKPELLRRFGCFIGCSLLKKDATARFERLVYRTIEEALADSVSEKARETHQKALRLEEILEDHKITTVYQPIVDLTEGRIFGYEVLMRGPKGEFERPEALFEIAYKTEMVWKLERMSRQETARSLPKLKGDQLIFVNVEPASIFDPELTENDVFAKERSRIVFEITERAAIDDFRTFREAVQRLKNLGFKVSVDDVGSAYSGLRLIAAIEPHFIKLDMELTRGVDDSRVKAQLVEAISRFSTEAKLPLIVEGVETKKELSALREIGIRYAQGFLFARPASRIGHRPTYIPALDSRVRPPRRR